MRQAGRCLDRRRARRDGVHRQVAAFDGQVGQQAYSASKGGVVGMTLPHGARPGAARHPRVHHRAGPVRHAADEAAARAGAAVAGGQHPVPASAWASPKSSRELACHIVTNGHLNGEVIRLDGALRMAPR
jgi:hypothetical protein